MKYIKGVIGRAAEMGVLLVTASGVSLAVDQPCDPTAGNIQNGANCAQPSGTPSDLFANFKLITNTLIFIVGAVAVVMLIIGGLRYVTSGGDAAGVKGAKDTILYAIIGIVVAILAYAIVNFVIFNVTKGT